MIITNPFKQYITFPSNAKDGQIVRVTNTTDHDVQRVCATRYRIDSLVRRQRFAFNLSPGESRQFIFAQRLDKWIRIPIFEGTDEEIRIASDMYVKLVG